MRLRWIAFMLLIPFFSFSDLWASDQHHRLNGQTFSFSANEHWRVEKEALGMPLSLWGKVNDQGVRPVLSVVMIDLAIGKTLFKQSIEQLKAFYQVDRQAWFAKRKASKVIFSEPLISAQRIELGVRYTLEGEKEELIEERSIYLLCAQGTLHVKGLERGHFSTETLQLLRSFQCR